VSWCTLAQNQIGESTSLYKDISRLLEKRSRDAANKKVDSLLLSKLRRAKAQKVALYYIKIRAGDSFR